MIDVPERDRRAGATGPVDLLGLPPDELELRLGSHFCSVGAPSYRGEQVLRWIYETVVRSSGGMTNLTARDGERLARSFALAEPEVVRVSRSSDGTAKHLWQLADGELVESVLILSRGRLTLCLSSQVGCAMGCTFCSTG